MAEDTAPTSLVPDGFQQPSAQQSMKFESQADLSLPKPMHERGCTDLLWLIIFICHWVVFVGVTMQGVSDGDISKLYRPRDFRGDYCGAEAQWDNKVAGPNLKGFPSLVYLMNTTDIVDVLAKQLICSKPVEQVYRGLAASSKELDDYECGCCLKPCAGCLTALNLAGVAGKIDVAGVGGAITAMVTELNDNPVAFYSAKGANLGQFSSAFTQVGRSTIGACVVSCSLPKPSSTTMRTYSYSPDRDARWAAAWHTLKSSTSSDAANVKAVMEDKFQFLALPAASCPYDPAHCVPMPGMEFVEVAAGWCSYKAIDDVGLALSELGENVQADKIAGEAEASIGNWIGDLVVAMDGLAITAVCSFVVALVFMVLLRFLLFWMIWLSIFFGWVCMMSGGTAMIVRSNQCKGLTWKDTAHSYGSYIQMKSGVTSFNAFDGAHSVNVDMAKEVVSGSGEDYAGVQRKTRSGHTCQVWNSTVPHELAMEYVEKHAELADARNYCRNPGGVAMTIWCYTASENVTWEYCYPVGHNPMTGECPDGYTEPSAVARRVLKVAGWTLLVLSLIYFVVVCCLRRSINLAIDLAEMAASFIFKHPHVILLPICQGLVNLLWCVIWIYLAALLLSQVPAGAVPTESYATWAEAAGTDEEPGKCTSSWPTGFAWKTKGDINSPNDPCSGNKGDITGITPRCWRCGPPRFMFDAKFAYSLFSFLWTLALSVALGQYLAASVVCWWAFEIPTSTSTPLRKSIRTALRNHLGSLCMGSFIVAVVQFLEAIVYYLTQQARAQKNFVMEYIGRCLQCCLRCIEKSIKAINRHAYIQIALNGTNFCNSAIRGMRNIVSNVRRFAVTAMVAWAIECTGKAFVVGSTGILAYLIIDGLHPDESLSAVPLFVAALMGYVVAELFMELFSLTVVALLHCYVEAEEKVSSCADLRGRIDQCNLPSESLRSLGTTKQKQHSGGTE